jgi:hypothetical protein
MNVNENKNSFFSITLPTSEYKNNEIYLEDLSNKTDLIFGSMGVKNTLYKFKEKDNNEIVFLFRTETRKRKGQLTKYCDCLLPDNQTYSVKGITKYNFEIELMRLENNPNFVIEYSPIIFEDYTASDLEIFKDKEKWHPWQKDIYKKVFDDDGEFKPAHPRHIISIVDKQGNSGKSSFFKWLFYTHPESIGRLGYGSASQLRSSAVNIGKKKFYLIDLTRSKGKEDRQEDLLSALEDIKGGFISNAMYGSGRTLMMEPPHIIVSSNYVLDYNLLSGDRWDGYEIDLKLKLKKLKTKKKEEVKEKKKQKV